MVDTRFTVSLQILLTLAYHGEELTSSHSLGQILKTNATFVRKLTARLVEAGLIESFRGKHGGIKLARSPKDIGLDEIYCAATTDKPLVCSPNKPITKACKVSCSMSDIFEEVTGGMEQASKAYLAKRKLSDLMKKVR